ncbi:hypothetical protein KSP40_PGU006254 [Platanthera guangdongensis]|uniref:Kinesin motor domain-containing protein n=1 Tax=Platanthera guangdongensis TaxID=2320717 RepID=A0ABR2M9P0_9ASPA
MEKKHLLNLLQKTKGNIKVFCRCRPLNLKEISSNCAPINRSYEQSHVRGSAVGGRRYRRPPVGREQSHVACETPPGTRQADSFSFWEKRKKRGRAARPFSPIFCREASTLYR